MGLFDVVRRQAGLKTGPVVYGVGDHGGGPTGRDVERGNRRAELALGEAEAVSACASVTIGAKVRRTAIEEARQIVLSVLLISAMTRFVFI